MMAVNGSADMAMQIGNLIRLGSCAEIFLASTSTRSSMLIVNFTGPLANDTRTIQGYPTLHSKKVGPPVFNRSDRLTQPQCRLLH
jgi:hypothetical protein